MVCSLSWNRSLFGEKRGEETRIHFLSQNSKLPHLFLIFHLSWKCSFSVSTLWLFLFYGHAITPFLLSNWNRRDHRAFYGLLWPCLLKKLRYILTLQIAESFFVLLNYTIFFMRWIVVMVFNFLLNMKEGKKERKWERKKKCFIAATNCCFPGLKLNFQLSFCKERNNVCWKSIWIQRNENSCLIFWSLSWQYIYGWKLLHTAWEKGAHYFIVCGWHTVILQKSHTISTSCVGLSSLSGNKINLDKPIACQRF